MPASNSKKTDEELFDLDAYIAKDPQPAYEFTSRGRTWTMTNMHELDIWGLLAAAEGGDLAATTSVLAAAFGDEQFAEFKESGPLPQRAFEELFKRYRKFCGVDEGKSPASTSS